MVLRTKLHRCSSTEGRRCPLPTGDEFAVTSADLLRAMNERVAAGFEVTNKRVVFNNYLLGQLQAAWRWRQAAGPEAAKIVRAK